ncbi:MAG: hypothetical protein EZS28_036064, partial [Streblomastix strix]
ATRRGQHEYESMNVVVAGEGLRSEDSERRCGESCVA